MTENLETIYEGHATIIKKKEYLSPKAYIEPFVERLSQYTNNFVCNVKPADQLSIDDEPEMVYNKVLITAVFPEEYDIECTRFDKPYNYHRVICMTYGLDCKTPYCKFYTGVVDQEFNFYAFGGDCISMQKIEPETALDYTGVDQIIKNGLSDNCKEMINQFDSMSTVQEAMLEHLGDWVDYTLRKEYINDSGKVKLSANMAVNAYKLLMIDKDSDYYSDAPEVSMHDMYCSWASQITSDDKDLTNRYEKTQLINKLFNL